jgi:hypothetical protein
MLSPTFLPRLMYSDRTIMQSVYFCLSQSLETELDLFHLTKSSWCLKLFSPDFFLQHFKIASIG